MGRWQPDARMRLQEAALALYSERGYDETTVAQIAERAGLTKRTFFRYFADKREVLFWGAQFLEQRMVAGIDAAPASASVFGLIGAALDAAAVQFEEVREFAGQRYRIISSSPELQERELIKTASLATAVASAMRKRGIGETAADLAAHTATTVMHIAYTQWVEDAEQRPFEQIARQALGQLRELVAAAE